MWQSLHDAWWRLATQSHPRSFLDVLASRVLQTGSVAYQAVVALRNTAYERGWTRQAQLPCRVVSVGNLTVGGTGKTTCVELMAKKLTVLGRRVAVLSRGYGGARKEYWLQWERGRLAVDGSHQATDDGLAPFETGVQTTGLADEPQLLARHLEGIPVIVGARRERTGAQACRQFAVDTVVLDDGFQHRRLHRDCDIVLVHARMPFSGWAVLPRGPMREPLASLKRADIVIVTKADEALETVGALTERLRSFAPEAIFATAVHEPASLLDAWTGDRQPLQRLDGLRVGLLSSIGDPEGFEATVKRLHATVAWHRAFPDHHRYVTADWAAIVERAKESRIEAVLTTEKDWVRLHACTACPGEHQGRAGAEREPLRVPLWVLGVRMKLLEGEETLDARLARVYGR